MRRSFLFKDTIVHIATEDKIYCGLGGFSSNSSRCPKIVRGDTDFYCVLFSKHLQFRDSEVMRCQDCLNATKEEV